MSEEVLQSSNLEFNLRFELLKSNLHLFRSEFFQALNEGESQCSYRSLHYRQSLNFVVCVLQEHIRLDRKENPVSYHRNEPVGDQSSSYSNDGSE